MRYPTPRHHRQRLGLAAIAIGLAIAPLAALQAAPNATLGVTNLGRLSVGGTVSASSTSLSFAPSQAFDGQFFGLSKASAYEDGWVARGGIGSWIERRWPGPAELVGLTLTRRVNRTLEPCDAPRDVDVSFTGGPAVPIRLADTNAPQHFPFAANAARYVRLTVRSTYGADCTSSAIGFSEIELYGRPKNWTPANSTTAAVSLPTGTIPPHTLQFTYDASLPLDTQAYLDQLLTAVIPTMTEVLGPPLDAQTLTVRIDPTYGSFTYAATLSTLTISRLPNAALPPGDPLNWDFNANLVHELAHAYQSVYGAASPPWFREGFAQAATDLMKQVLRERGTPLLQNTTIDEGAALRTYDAVANMGPEVLTSLWDGNGRFIPYAEAEGLWWILLLSQSSPRPNGTFAELDFFRRVETALLERNPGNGQAERRAFLNALAPNPIDGLPVETWMTRQPIVFSAPYWTALGFYPGDCFCAGNTSAEAQHLIIVLRQLGSPVRNAALRVTLRNAVDTVVSDETVSLTDYGFGFYYYTFPILIDRLPTGRYDITVSTVLNGLTLSATTSIARGSRTPDAAAGLGLVRRLAQPADPLAVTVATGTYDPVSPENGVLRGLAGLSPQDLDLTVGGRPVHDTVFLPAPYTRFVNLP